MHLQIPAKVGVSTPVGATEPVLVRAHQTNLTSLTIVNSFLCADRSPFPKPQQANGPPCAPLNPGLAGARACASKKADKFDNCQQSAR